jgi:hypothetical protein
MQLRPTSGEVLLVTHPDKAALLTFVNSNDLKVERRISPARSRCAQEHRTHAERLR